MITTRNTPQCDRCRNKFAEKEAIYIAQIPTKSTLLCYDCATSLNNLEKITQFVFNKEILERIIKILEEEK